MNIWTFQTTQRRTTGSLALVSLCQRSLSQIMRVQETCMLLCVSCNARCNTGAHDCIFTLMHASVLVPQADAEAEEERAMARVEARLEVVAEAEEAQLERMAEGDEARQEAWDEVSINQVSPSGARKSRPAGVLRRNMGGHAILVMKLFVCLNAAGGHPPVVILPRGPLPGGVCSLKRLLYQDRLLLSARQVARALACFSSGVGRRVSGVGRGGSGRGAGGGSGGNGPRGRRRRLRARAGRRGSS